jgi:peptidoglycan/LPS O-acetylase OafA/YrhL
LRGFAALSVLAGHYTANYHRVFGHSDSLLFSYPYAGYGVTLFFMISGFVILMTAERAARPMDFAWARFTRLYPAYWTAVVLTFTVLSVFVLPGRRASLARAVANLTMFQHFFGVGNVDSVYWTLHVELCFYAIVLALLCLKKVRHTEWVLTGLVALSLIDTELFGRLDGAWAARLRELLILDHAFAFLIGVILYRSLKSPKWWHLPVILACLAAKLPSGPPLDAYVSAGLALLVFVTTRGYLKFLETRALVFLGTISYPLYLTHQNIGYVIIRGGYARGLNPNVSIALATLVAVGLATVITYWVERPAMAFLRDRRPGRRAAAAVPPRLACPA